MAFRYRAFGLGISSFQELPELRADRSRSVAEVTIERGIDTPSDEDVERFGHLLSPSRVLLQFPGVGDFAVRPSSIEIAAAADASAETIRSHVVGPALGVLLRLRGSLVLHANAVAVPGGVIGIMGEGGSGKSTLAAALAMQGAALFTDDVLALDTVGDEPVALLGSLRAKLSWASLDALGLREEDFREVYPGLGKRDVRLGPSPTADALPLRLLVSLEAGSEPGITIASPLDASVAIVRNTFAVNLLRGLVDDRAHLRECATVVRSVPVVNVRTALDGSSLASVQELAKRLLTGLEEGEFRTTVAR